MLSLKPQANLEVIAIGLCPFFLFLARLSLSPPLHVYLSS